MDASIARPNQGNAVPIKSEVIPAPTLPLAARPVTPKGLVSGEERRRSQRVLVRIRASVHVALNGTDTTLPVTTLSVNDHGALVVIERNLPLDTPLVLEHGGTRERVSCKVARPAREMPEGFHVPLEFDAPAPDFWKIAFPPSDWRPDDM
jgi:hypothetical protein